MNNFELAAKCIEVALKYKTLYVYGGIGYRLDKAGKDRALAAYAYNRRWDRKPMIMAATADTWAFDCVNLIKAILWGWKGDMNAIYGGAKYCSNGVPDIGADATIGICAAVNGDFRQLEIGEAVWTDGHIGVYIGNGLAVECSPKWANGVQITAVENMGKKKGYNNRTWKKHGKLPWVKYYTKGDIDFDGKVTAADARKALRAAVDLDNLNDAEKLAADMDGDGEITAADSREILRKSVGLEDGK